MTESRRTFLMPLTPHANAVLVFDATVSEDKYAIYAIQPDEGERFRRGEWDAMKESLAPKGHVPFTDVEVDDTQHVIRVRTLGMERFAS
jgi:hypothetical protein